MEPFCFPCPVSNCLGPHPPFLVATLRSSHIVDIMRLPRRLFQAELNIPSVSSKILVGLFIFVHIRGLKSTRPCFLFFPSAAPIYRRHLENVLVSRSVLTHRHCWVSSHHTKKFIEIEGKPFVANSRYAVLAGSQSSNLHPSNVRCACKTIRIKLPKATITKPVHYWSVPTGSVAFATLVTHVHTQADPWCRTIFRTPFVTSFKTSQQGKMALLLSFAVVSTSPSSALRISPNGAPRFMRVKRFDAFVCLLGK